MTTDTVTTALVEKKPRGRPRKEYEPLKILDVRKNSEGAEVYFVEVPPQKVTANCGYSYQGNANSFEIFLPWTYYVVSKLGGTDSKWGNTPARARVATALGRPVKTIGLSQERFYYLPLPNLYGGSKTFCRGNEFTADNSMTPEILVNNAISTMWDGSFTYLRPTTEPAVWTKISKLANTSMAMDSVGVLLRWWSTLSQLEVLKFPWGKVCWGTYKAFLEDPSYGFSGFRG